MEWRERSRGTIDQIDAESWWRPPGRVATSGPRLSAPGDREAVGPGASVPRGQGSGQGLRGVPVPDEMEPTNGDGVALSLVTSGRDEAVSELRGEA